MNETKVSKTPILLDDRTARYIFSSNLDALVDFLKSLFKELNYDIDIQSITRIDSEKLIPARKRQLKDQYVDLLCLINDIVYCNIEFYKTFDEEKLQKSLSYLTRLYGNQLEIGMSYINNLPVLSINIVMNNKIDKKFNLVNEYSLIDGVSAVMLTDKIKFIVIDIDKISNLGYTRSRFKKWICLLKSTSLEELKERAKGDKIMEMVVKSADEFFTPGGIDRAIPEDLWHQARAREEGIEQATERIAKLMFADGKPINEISKYSGIPKDVILSWQE